ncbi:MAG: fibronectin type III domain-containing protein [Ruminococcus sp.]|nr:fibronectin type III domain-containing protein [Ruminococcus sp.]
MKCRIKKIVTAASAVALTFAATPSMKLYAASVDEAPKVVSTAGADNTVVKAAVNETWADKTVLEKDTIVDGDLILKADVDLNGYNLIVNGDLKNISGTITPNGGNLAVKGNYDLGNPSVTAAGDTVYSNCTGGLIVDGSDVTVDGDFITHNVSAYYGVRLTSGTLSIGGNININGGVKVDYDNGTRIVLNGKGKQDISFAGCPKLNELEIWDSEKRDVCWHGDLNAKKLVADARIKPVDMNLCELDMDGHGLTIDGTFTKGSGTVDLNGGTLIVKGDFKHPTGSVVLNGGSLCVDGDYLLENPAAAADGSIAYSTCTGELIMENINDNVTVNGDLRTRYVSIYNGLKLICGNLYLSGNVDVNNGLKIDYENDSKIVLIGKGAQDIRFENCPKLNLLEIWDSEKRDVSWNGNMNVRKLVNDTRICPVDLKLCELDMDGHSLTIDGSCSKSSGTVNLNGGTLKINGDFAHPTGSVVLNGGSLYIDACYLLENPDGKGDYSTCTGELIMNNADDIVTVNGTFRSAAVSAYYGLKLNTGVVYFASNVCANSGLKIDYENDAKIVFNGKGAQDIRFFNCPKLNLVEIWDSEKRSVYWNGVLNAYKLLEDATVIPVDMVINDFDLDGHKFFIKGNVTKDTGNLRLGAGAVLETGRFDQKAGSVVLDGGALFIHGDYTLAAPGSKEGAYNNCTGSVYMNNTDDIMFVEGSFVTHNVSAYYGAFFNCGTLQVLEDILVDTNCFRLGSTASRQYTVLNGKRAQTIKLPKGVKFDSLEINKPLSFYDFSEDNCWAELNNTFKAENPKVEYAKGKGCVKLTWGEAFCADKYGIAMYVDGKWKMIDQGPGTSYVLNNLKPGVNYKVAVVARFGGEWNMDVSNAIVVTPQTENRYPVVKYQVSGSQFRLKWTPADGAQKYGLAVYQSGKWVAKVQFDANTTTYTSPKMKKGSYTMAVCAKVNGKWDVDHIKQRSFTVTIK